MDPWFWKLLAKLTDVIWSNTTVCIGDGHKVSFWFDNWCSLGPLISALNEQEQQALGLHRDTTIFQSSAISWPRQRRLTHQLQVLQQEHAVIMSRLDGTVDCWWWKPSSNGAFSIKSMWNILRAKGQLVSWKKIVWNPKYIPRQSFITWMLFHGRLGTRDRLKKWGIVADEICSFCAEKETMSHLFFACEFTVALWRLLLQKCNMYRANRPWNEEMCWCISSLKGKSFQKMLCKLALQSLISAVWYERNSRTFVDKFSTRDIIYFQVVSTIVQGANSWRKIKKTKTNWMLSMQWGISQDIFTSSLS